VAFLYVVGLASSGGFVGFGRVTAEEDAIGGDNITGLHVEEVAHDHIVDADAGARATAHHRHGVVVLDGIQSAELLLLGVIVNAAQTAEGEGQQPSTVRRTHEPVCDYLLTMTTKTTATMTATPSFQPSSGPVPAGGGRTDEPSPGAHTREGTRGRRTFRDDAHNQADEGCDNEHDQRLVLERVEDELQKGMEMGLRETVLAKAGASKGGGGS
jgi:hypothetical protein